MTAAALMLRHVVKQHARSSFVAGATVTTIAWRRERRARAEAFEAAIVPMTAAKFAVERAHEHAAALSAAAKQNVLQRLGSYCRRLARLAYAWARLSALGTPLLATAPLRKSLGTASDELWWRYFLWATHAAGPTAVKLAQWASSREDRFPQDFCDRFSHRLSHSLLRRPLICPPPECVGGLFEHHFKGVALHVQHLWECADCIRKAVELL